MSLLLPMHHYPLHYMKRVGETDKLRGCAEHLIAFLQRVLINAIIREQECKILFYIIWHENCILFTTFEPKRHNFAIRKRDGFMDINA